MQLQAGSQMTEAVVLYCIPWILSLVGQILQNSAVLILLYFQDTRSAVCVELWQKHG